MREHLYAYTYIYIIKSIKLSKMRWVGHVVRMRPERITSKFLIQPPSIKDQEEDPKRDGKIMLMMNLPY